MNNIDYSLLPEHIRDGARLYIERGVQPGGFLTAVICNDLKGSFACADEINRHKLFEIVRFFYNEAPGGCWGSLETMRKWMAAMAQKVSA